MLPRVHRAFKALSKTADRTAEQGGQQPVGKPPSEPQRKTPEVQAIPELGGVLTPGGKLVVEPSIQYSHSQVNRFTFLGIEILDTFLIGLLEAEDTDRDLFTPALTGRLGVTDRFELELKVPYVIRNDRVSFVIPQVDPNQDTDRRNRRQMVWAMSKWPRTTRSTAA